MIKLNWTWNAACRATNCLFCSSYCWLKYSISFQESHIDQAHANIFQAAQELDEQSSDNLDASELVTYDLDQNNQYESPVRIANSTPNPSSQVLLFNLF